MFAFLKIAEQRILEAQKRGDFDNLPGKGRPLDLDSDTNVPEDLRMAYKMLKNSGFVPPEIELARQIRQAEDVLAGMEDTQAKYKAMKKLNMLIRRLNMMRTGSVTMDFPEYYERKLVERFGGKTRE